MNFRLDGDLSRIVVPSPGTAVIGTELWRHTCFEAFIAVERKSAYHEFNFAPSGQWAVYALCGYRSGGLLANEAMSPDIAVRADGNRLELDARVQLDHLSAIHPRARLRIGLATVIEESDRLSYWAVRHPLDKPDFHNDDGFALLLEPPGQDG